MSDYLLAAIKADITHQVIIRLRWKKERYTTPNRTPIQLNGQTDKLLPIQDTGPPSGKVTL